MLVKEFENPLKIDKVVDVDQVYYEGHSINKLQNSVILLVLQILKIRNMRFVGNLTLSSSCEFYDDDVTVTSFINVKYSDVATEILL